jgi:hypothetical protein
MASQSESRHPLVDSLPGEPVSWDSPEDLSRLSAERFMFGESPDRGSQSLGHLHLVDPSTDAHGARLDAVGRLAAMFQKVVSSTAAALEGQKSLRGQLSATVRSLTQLQLATSPMPGSVVLRVEPEHVIADELYPGGQRPLIDEQMPLIDRSVSELVALLDQGVNAQTATEEAAFRDHIAELGPRAAGAVRELVTLLSDRGIELGVDWSAPTRTAASVRVTRDAAARITALVKNQKLDTEIVELPGVLHTISKSRAWDLETDTGELIRIRKGRLVDDDVSELHVDQRVVVRAEMTPIVRAWGDTTYEYTAISVEPAGSSPA